MTGIGPADGYAVGFHKGASDHDHGQPKHPDVTWPADQQMGYGDGFEWAEDKAREAAEDRALLAANSLLPAEGPGL